MEFDVVVVGAGPAGLAAACRLRQLAAEGGREISVCVVEKGSEVGAHILSGAVLETRALSELFPDWKEKGAPVETEVKEDAFLYYLNRRLSLRLPGWMIPRPMRNHGNYIVSMGQVCRWLAEQAEALGAEIYPGFAAAEVLYREDGTVGGIITGDMGLSAGGERKPGFTPGMELRGKYTLFAEGCRGHLGKRLIERFGLAEGKDPQHYGIGIKEIWEIPADAHRPGLVLHSLGWPLTEGGASGGGFLYHAANRQVYLGMIIDLNYRNPRLDPFAEMQRWKRHPATRKHLEGGTRISYGARAVAKGGLNSLPQMHFPGGLLIGCDAGTLNSVKIKGNHTAMKSGMLAAESAAAALLGNGAAHASAGAKHAAGAAASDSGSAAGGGRQLPAELTDYAERIKRSWLYDDLYRARNFTGWVHRLGTVAGAACLWLEQNLFGGKLPFTLRDRVPDHDALKPAANSRKIRYPKPDNVISFDRLSSVFLSNTNHEEDQPCHLQLKKPEIPLGVNLPTWDEPAQRYCPAGVYEVVEEAGEPRFQINAQNCVHCKTCDIKDPSQNIEWVTPEGSGGPNYGNM